MIAFKRRSDGFEWHKYVRTTIKLKRQDRKRRINEAGQAAASGFKQAGKASATAGVGLLAALADLTVTALGRLWMLVLWLLGRLADGLELGLGLVWRGFLFVWDQLDWIAGQRLVRQCALIGLVVGSTWTLARLVGSGVRPPADALIAAGVAVLGGFLLAVPPITTHAAPVGRMLGRLLPRRENVPDWFRQAIIPGLVVIAVVVGAAGYLWTPVRKGLRDVVSVTGLVGQRIEGRASVVGPDELRVAGTTVKLSGLESVLSDPSCGDRRRRCSASAQATLQEMVRGRLVSCTIDGNRTGSCEAGGTDLGAAVEARLSDRRGLRDRR